MFGHVSDRFSDPFSRFSNHFWYRLKWETDFYPVLVLGGIAISL